MNKINIKQIKNIFRKWKAFTTTAPSDRHIGYHKFLFVSNGEKYKDEIIGFTHEMLQFYFIILNTAIDLSLPLTKGGKSVVLMIETFHGNTEINNIRVVHIYKSDYNLFLELF